MLSLLRSSEAQEIPAEIAFVGSDNPSAPGLGEAVKAGIPCFSLDAGSFPIKAEFEAALIRNIREFDIDCLCLAGFMRVLSPDFLNNTKDKIILNIHPSLLPAYKGLNVHERVLEAGEKWTGCTVHHVTSQVDTGDIVIQKQIEVKSDDTPATLSKRVLNAEHEIYPEAIRIITSSKTTI